MNRMQIGSYEQITPFQTAGSGNARWCMARKDGGQYFLKQFLAPVQPLQTTETPTTQVLLRREKCAAFETRKIALYDALKNIQNDSIVRVESFFVHDGHYFAASRWIEAQESILAKMKSLSVQNKLHYLLMLTKTLQDLHCAGIVHADLKPEHIIIENCNDTPVLRLLDFDSGFLETKPPAAGNELEVDPVYLAPEAFQLLSGAKRKLSYTIDIFALGILFHQILAGKLPDFDKEEYSYLYAAVLDGGQIGVSKELSGKQQVLIRRMLRARPSRRPDDQTIISKLKGMLL